MKRLFPLLFTLGAIGTLSAQPTWADDISCIVYKHCSNCHNDFGVAPFNLMSYDEVFASRFAVESAVVNKNMPPWMPDQEYAPMAYANVLSAEEIQLISDWVAAGAPEGNPADAPEPPVFETEMEIPDADWTITTDEFTVPNNSSDLYKCFVVQTNFAEDRYITAMEILPSNRNIVHHVLIYEDISNDPIEEDNDDPNVGFECYSTPPTNSPTSNLIGEWVPGSTARYLPEGTGIKIPAGTNIIIQVHYPEGTSGQSDFTTVNMNFTTDPNVREIYNDQLLDHLENIDNFLIIFPYTTPTFHEEYTVPYDMSLISVFPHAHLICERMWSYAELPNGDIINLVDIPKWDFNWQGFYHYPQPIFVPEGTKLHGYAKYDNTPDNPNNPNNPPQLVTLGEATTDEMMLFFYSFMEYQPGDENIMIYDISSDGVNDACSNSVGIYDIDEKVGISIFPNPVMDGGLNVDIAGEIAPGTEIEITDVTGRVILKTVCDSDRRITLPNGAGNGMYFARLIENGVQVSKTQKITVLK